MANKGETEPMLSPKGDRKDSDIISLDKNDDHDNDTPHGGDVVDATESKKKSKPILLLVYVLLAITVH